MAYLAFYRTFRPTKLDEVVRQEHIVKILKNQIETGKIGHAYLFCGPRGTGKTTIAKIFARAINCENPQNGSPCGVCPTCKALASGSNLDISEIDAASNNGVDEMRDLRDKVQYPPVAGKYKVYIIDEVHMLTQSAFNAVLKTLEEPPRHAVFILATTEPQKIPATILSRCMRFDFKLLPQADLEGLLKRVFDKVGKEYEDEAVAAIARAGAGSARDSLSIADMCASYSLGKLTYEDVNAVLGATDFSLVAQIVHELLEQDASSALASVEAALGTGKGVGVLLRDLITLVNNVVIVKMCKNAQEIVNVPTDRFTKMQQLASETDGHKLLRITEVLTKAETDLRYSLNGRITLETAILKCAMPDSDYNIDALLGRVARLEQQVKEGVKVQVEAMPATSKGVAQVERAVAPTERPVAPTAQGVEVPTAREFGQTAKVAEQTHGVVAHSDESNGIARNNLYGADTPAQTKEEKGNRKLSAMEEAGSSPFDSPFQNAQTVERKQPEKPQATSQPSAQQPQNAQQPVQTVQADQQNLWESHVNPAGLNAQTAGALTEENKKTVFAKFLRALRTTRKNAVLFTLCMDLENVFEGDKLVLITSSDAVYRALNREDNRAYIGETLAPLGVFDFEIRSKQRGEDAYEKDVNQLKQNFGPNFTIK
jgi:DNA polymerase-3 subunit gamma/tau